MKKWCFILLYLLVIGGLIVSGVVGDKTVAVISENTQMKRTTYVVVDAGHGGVDGGATSCTGVLESNINLEIALKLNDLLHFMGVPTITVRTNDCSVYTSGDTIGAKKVSDLKERVRIVESTPNALLVSIHQNYFSQSQYSGAQVFYNKGQGSEALANAMQSLLKQTLNPTSKRQPKKATGIYLMEKISKPGVLIECGFLSNPQEESLLRNPNYQNKLCCVIAASVSNHLFGA